MSELAQYFASKKEIEIHLILYGITREIFYPIPDSIITYKPTFRFNNSWRLIYTIVTLFFIRKTVKRINPTSILSFGEYWNSFILIALYRLKYPVFVSDRCQPDKSLGVMHDFLRKKLYPKARGIIAQTIKAGDIYRIQLNHKNIRVIGNPIRSISPGKDVIREKIVLMVGRLIKSKNQDKLIEIFLNISRPGWKLVIVGYDHLKQDLSYQLKRIISKNQAQDLIKLEGKKSDVEAYYLKSSIFAFTSSSEGFPNVIGEAMSAGLPVIAFDCVAGPSEMIKDNLNGFLVPLFNYGYFQDKLEVLMKNEELRTLFGNKAREDIQQFSITKIGDQYLQFLLS